MCSTAVVEVQWSIGGKHEEAVQLMLRLNQVMSLGGSKAS